MTVQLRKVIQCKQKNGDETHMGPTPANSTNGTVRCSLTLKKKIVFKIRKDYLRIIFFLMDTKDLCFKQVHKYARLRKQ